MVGVAIIVVKNVSPNLGLHIVSLRVSDTFYCTSTTIDNMHSAGPDGLSVWSWHS